MCQWYEEQIAEIKAAFDDAVRILAYLPDWKTQPKLIKQLQREHAGLWELRLYIDDDKDKKYRQVGFVSRPLKGQYGQGEFVFLLGCHKRWQDYVPPNAFDTALSLRSELLDNKGSTHARPQVL